MSSSKRTKMKRRRRLCEKHPFTIIALDRHVLNIRGRRSRHLWFPAFFVRSSPHFHGGVVILNATVSCVQGQLPTDLPCNVRDLKHRNGDVAVRNWSMEFFARTNRSDKVGE